MLSATDVVVSGPTIAEVGRGLSAAETVDGRGCTLVPGLIDCHTHTWGDALQRALAFGVTTELDMFTDHRWAAERRAEQTDDAPVDRADLFSCGPCATAPDMHGTMYGIEVPTITDPAEAEAWVDARIAERSDYIKIIHGRQGTTREVMSALVDAAHRRGLIAMVHEIEFDGWIEAVAAGACMAHLFCDRAGDDGFAAVVAERGGFVVPTLSVIAAAARIAFGATLADDERLAPHLRDDEREFLRALPDWSEGLGLRLDYANDAVAALHAAGVPILVGSDTGNPGTAHGASVHGELELLVAAGLSPIDALRGATSLAASCFRLADRGRIEPGLRADLMLVRGDPSLDITSTRDIVGVWKLGRRSAQRGEDRRG